MRGAGGEARWSAVVARYLSRSARGAHSAALAQPGLRTCAAPALASATKRCPSQKCGTRVAKGTACIGGARAGSHEICPRGGARAPRQPRRAAPHVRCCSAHPRIVATALEEQFQRGWSSFRNFRFYSCLAWSADRSADRSVSGWGLTTFTFICHPLTTKTNEGQRKFRHAMK